MKNSFLKPEIVEMMDILNTLTNNKTFLECFSNREIIVDGCNAILEYTDTLIRLSTKEMTLKISGVELTISAMERKGLIIKGIISSLEFVR